MNIRLWGVVGNRYNAVLLAAALTACGGGTGSGAPASTTPAAAVLSGSVHGGQQPVTGSQVVAYAAGVGFGASATPLACVMTDSGGNFHFGASGQAGVIACTAGPVAATTFSCPVSGVSCQPDSQIYLVSSGGNPGLAAGTNNSALVLLSALGPFRRIAANAFVDISELSTAASVYALAQMMTGSAASGCVDCGANLPSELANAQNIVGNQPGLDNAAARALSLLGTGTAASPLPAASSCTGGSSDPVNCGAEEKLNSLADALAACVNTGGSTSSACVQLFCVATPGASFSGAACTPPAGGAIPANTLQSALSIALNPGTVPASGIFSLVAATPPFTPVLAAAPTDWTLALNFTDSGLNAPIGVAIDAGGNVWVVNDNSPYSVIKLSNSGAVLSPSAGYTGGGLNGPHKIAIDAGGNVWVVNGVGSVTELSSSGAPLSPSTGYTGGGLSLPDDIAIDANGNVWVANQNNNSVTQLSSQGMALSPSAGYTGGGMSQPYSIAIDAGGNVWTANLASYTLAELSGSGAPLSPPGGYSGGGLNQPVGIAIDAGGNVWATNIGNSSVSKFSSSGVPLSPLAGYTGGGLNVPQGIAIDGGGNVWVANSGTANNVTELSNSGAPLSPSTGYTGGGLRPFYIAIDSSGNVWVTNYTGSGGSVTELVGAAAPVKTPLIGPPQSP